MLRNLIRYGKYTVALRRSQIFYIQCTVFVLRVEIVTIFEPKVVTISARNTKGGVREFRFLSKSNFPSDNMPSYCCSG